MAAAVLKNWTLEMNWKLINCALCSSHSAQNLDEEIRTD